MGLAAVIEVGERAEILREAERSGLDRIAFGEGLFALFDRPADADRADFVPLGIEDGELLGENARPVRRIVGYADFGLFVRQDGLARKFGDRAAARRVDVQDHDGAVRYVRPGERVRYGAVGFADPAEVPFGRIEAQRLLGMSLQSAEYRY